MSPIIQLATVFALVSPLSSLPAHSPLETQYNQGWEDYLGDEVAMREPDVDAKAQFRDVSRSPSCCSRPMGSLLGVSSPSISRPS